MRILLSPQVRETDKLWYEIEHQKIIVTINDVTDTFDFSEMPDGELQMYDDDGNYLIETTLELVPIIKAVKKDGILEVEILFSVDLTEQDERLLFPEPMTLDEFNDLMAELVARDKEVESDGEDGLEEQ